MFQSRFRIIAILFILFVSFSSSSFLYGMLPASGSFPPPPESASLEQAGAENLALGRMTLFSILMQQIQTKDAAIKRLYEIMMLLTTVLVAKSSGVQILSHNGWCNDNSICSNGFGICNFAWDCIASPCRFLWGGLVSTPINFVKNAVLGLFSRTYLLAREILRYSNPNLFRHSEPAS